MNTGRICSLYLVHMVKCDLRQQDNSFCFFAFFVCVCGKRTYSQEMLKSKYNKKLVAKSDFEFSRPIQVYSNSWEI